MSFQPNAPIGVDDPLSLDSTWRPMDHGFIAWSYDPATTASTAVISAAGTVNTVRLRLNYAASITNVHFYVSVVGATLTANQCLAGLYQGRKLIGTTADQSVAWVSTGLKTMALTGGPFTVPAGECTVAFFYNGTTSPSLMRGAAAAAFCNSNLATAAARFATADTGRTTSFADPLGTLTTASNGFWAAIS